MSQITPEAIIWCLQNREAALALLDRADCKAKLINFVQMFWGVTEPSRKFVRGWAVEAICEHLEAVTSGQITRLLITVPPGSSKSRITNVYWPAWEWGPKRMPHRRHFSAAYAASLTLRDNRYCRSVVTSPRYQELWMDIVQLADDVRMKQRFETTAMGWKIASSVGGMSTGERADVFLVDDPHSTKEIDSDAKREAALQFFTEVVPTRLNDPEKSAIVVIMQRVHERDVAGLILAQDLGYDHLCIPMKFESDHPTPSRTKLGWKDPRTEDGELMWPERFPARIVTEVLEKELSSWGGDFAVASQLQQRPAPRGGGMFKTTDWKIVEPGDVPKNGWVVRGWDLAATQKATSAYTAGVKMRHSLDGRIWIEDVRRARADAAGVEDLILACAVQDGRTTYVDVPQDPGAAGVAWKAAIARKLMGFQITFSGESGAKEVRALPLAAQVAAGNVALARAAWNDAYMAEAATFPRGTYKDQVDASSRAFTKLAILAKTRKVAVAGRIFEG